MDQAILFCIRKVLVGIVLVLIFNFNGTPLGTPTDL
jgi:hypothetical protein